MCGWAWEAKVTKLLQALFSLIISLCSYTLCLSCKNEIYFRFVWQSAQHLSSPTVSQILLLFHHLSPSASLYSLRLFNSTSLSSLVSAARFIALFLFFLSHIYKFTNAYKNTFTGICMVNIIIYNYNLLYIYIYTMQTTS